MNGFGFKIAPALDGRLRVERDPSVPATDGQVIPARLRRRMLCDATATAATGFATISEGMALSRSWLPWRRRKGQAMVAQGFRDLAEASVSAYAWAQADRTGFAAAVGVFGEIVNLAARTRGREEIAATFTDDELGAGAALRAAGHSFGGDGDFPSAGHKVDDEPAFPFVESVRRWRGREKVSGTTAALMVGDGLDFPDGEPTFTRDEAASGDDIASGRAKVDVLFGGGERVYRAPDAGHSFGGDGDFPSAGHEVDEGVVQPVRGSPRPLATGGVIRGRDPFMVGEHGPEAISPALAAVRAGWPDEQV